MEIKPYVFFFHNKTAKVDSRQFPRPLIVHAPTFSRTYPFFLLITFYEESIRKAIVYITPNKKGQPKICNSYTHQLHAPY